MHESKPSHPHALDHQLNLEFWNALINEGEAAHFLGLSVRTMQGYRYRGGGPRFVRISVRCIRYRRVDLQAWSDQKTRVNTSDQSDNHEC